MEVTLRFGRASRILVTLGSNNIVGPDVSVIQGLVISIAIPRADFGVAIQCD